MYKKFRIQIDEDPVFLRSWKNLIDSRLESNLTYGIMNNVLCDYNAYLVEETRDNRESYPILVFIDVSGYMEYMMRWS